MKKKNPTCDCTAEITVDDNNVDYLYGTVKALTKNGIWSSITIAETKKNKYYDFASDLSSSLATPVVINEPFLQIYNGAKSGDLLVHVPEVVKALPEIAPMNFTTCGGLDNTITIEPDGAIRLCLRIRGPRVSKFKVEDFNNKENYLDLLGAHEEDYDNCCEGCAWTCSMMPFYGTNDEITHK